MTAGRGKLPAQATTGATAGTQRLDQWLFFARIIKSRTLAATLITDGKFRLNKERVEKPSAVIKPGDVITSAAHRTVRVLKVTALATRRGPASEAQALYDDLTPAAPPPEPRAAPQAARDSGAGRPTKKERREIEKFRGR